MKNLIRLLTILTLIVWFSLTAFNAIGQTVVDCPHADGCVVLSREAAQAALEAGDKAKALEVQLKAEQDAKELIRKALEDMRIEFARVSGENTALKQNAVSDRAIIQILVQYARPKKIGLNLF